MTMVATNPRACWETPLAARSPAPDATRRPISPGVEGGFGFGRLICWTRPDRRASRIVGSLCRIPAIAQGRTTGRT